MADAGWRRAAGGLRRLLAALPLALGLPGVTGADETPAAFEEARVHFEQNATDEDVEVVFEVKGGDEGLSSLTIVGPDGRSVVDFRAPDASTLGIRSFHFESPEPRDIAALKAAYPEGVYRFDGATAGGGLFHGESTLRHALPTPVALRHPAPGAQAVSTLLEIRWSPVPEATGYVVEIEQEELGVELQVTLPASASSFSVPSDFLRAGTTYGLGIGAFTDDGNVSFVETTFETAEVQ